MSIFKVATYLLLLGGVVLAEEEIVEERASTAFVLVKASGESVFEGNLRHLEREGDKKIDRKEVDEEIQAWFDRQKTDNTDFYLQRKTKWEALIAETKQASRPDLEKAEARWRSVVNDAVQEFRASEVAFYQGKPTVTMRATYRYREGQKDPSGAKPNGWSVDEPLEFANAPEIVCSKTFDSGEIVVRVAGEQEPVVKVRQEWSVSMKARLEAQGEPGVRIPWEPQRPKSETIFELWFVGEQSSSNKLSRCRRDGKKYPLVDGPVFIGTWIGDSTLGTGVKVGSSFILAAGCLRGPVVAGKDLTADATNVGSVEKMPAR
jgi:hypothetical protein